MFERAREAKLVKWRERLRRQYVESRLSARQIQALRDEANINFGQTEQEWLRSFAEAAAVVGRYQELRAGGKMGAAERRVNVWFHEQVRLHRDGLLSESRIRLLNTLGLAHFVVRRRQRGREHMEKWFERAATIEAYVRETGRLPARDAISSEMRSLARWLEEQRRRMREGLLTVEQEDVIQRLDVEMKLDDLGLAMQLFEMVDGGLHDEAKMFRQWARQIARMHELGGISKQLWRQSERLVNHILS